MKRLSAVACKSGTCPTSRAVDAVFLSRACFVTEDRFWRLKGGWGCLLKRNDTEISLLSNVIAACCTLHNICEVHGDASDE